MNEIRRKNKKRIKIESCNEDEYNNAKLKNQRNDNTDSNNESKIDEFDVDIKRPKIEPGNGNNLNGILGKEELKNRKRNTVRFKAHYEESCKRVEQDDEIDEILEKIRADEQLPLVTIENLRNLTIKLRYEIPPQHQVERAAGSHVPSAVEKRLFQELAPQNQIKNGVFSPEEDQMIVNNWKAFCQDHHWDEGNARPFLYMRHNGEFYLKRESERRKFVQFLAHGLPRRTLYSVYHRFRILYDTPKLRNKYEPHEDKFIIKYIEHNKNIDRTRMFADLAKALNRSRASVWRRYKLLKQKRENGILMYDEDSI